MFFFSHKPSHSTSICKSPVAPSVCFLLHLFLKLKSSFNIASSHICSKVFSSWILSEFYSGIQIFPENKTHPTVSSSNLYCSCNFSCTIHNHLNSLHSHFLLPIVLRWKSLSVFSFCLWTSLLPVAYGFVGLNCYAIISLQDWCHWYHRVQSKRSIFASQCIFFKAIYQPGHSFPQLSYTGLISRLGFWVLCWSLIHLLLPGE